MNLQPKKLFMSAIAILAIGLTVSAQSIKVESIKKVALPKGMLVNTATVSPDGSYVVISELTGPGLKKMDFATGKSTLISSKGDGIDVKISADGSEVLYREYTTDANHLRWSSLKSKNVKTQKEQVIVTKSRDINGIAICGNKALVVDNRKLASKALASKANAEKEVVLSIVNGQLCVTQNGVTKTISPQGIKNTSYLWPELSPDGTRIAYFLRGTGLYVCDLNGKNVKPLGYYHAPKWLDDKTLIVMDDYDNGDFIVKSAIVAIDVNSGRTQSLTPSNIVATYPSVSKNKIVFTTPRGELYNINIK